jgi:proline dehydrogenase
MALDFSNTEIAFRSKSTEELSRARWLFRAVQWPWLVRAGAPVAELALKLRLPIKSLIEHTLFKQFCGGETIETCATTIADLWRHRVGTILDYSVEGLATDAGFEATAAELRRSIAFAEKRAEVPFAVFKASGIARGALLAKSQRGEALSADESAEWTRSKARFDGLCEEASRRNVRLFVDAEEASIQDVVDQWTRDAMARHNRGRVVLYGTLQLYRRDRTAFLANERRLARDGGYGLGFKLVRGAYLEKERREAAASGRPSPLWDTKAETDRAYDEALVECLEAIAGGELLEVCAGTHNEASLRLLAETVDRLRLARSDARVSAAQLLGMSDHLTFNLAASGFNAAKYVPYGPVELVFPYLVRRAEENSSVQDQTGRELSRIEAELRRRRDAGTAFQAPRAVV